MELYQFPPSCNKLRDMEVHPILASCHFIETRTFQTQKALFPPSTTKSRTNYFAQHTNNVPNLQTSRQTTASSLCGHTFAATTASSPVRLTRSDLRWETVLACSLGPVVGMAGLLLAAWWVWQRRKLHHAPFAQVPTAEPTPLPSPLVPPRSLQLIEVKAQGRFGAVWKARYGSQYVAVKIFPPQVGGHVLRGALPGTDLEPVRLPLRPLPAFAVKPRKIAHS